MTGADAGARPGARAALTVMVTWREFQSEAPDIAAVAVTLWPGITALSRGEPRPPGAPWFPIAFLATARRDGSPRLHPFCPVLAAGRLFAAIPRSSPKGDDLRRDPRCVIHALPGPEDNELVIRARATEAGHDAAVRAAIITVITPSGVGGMIQTVTNDPVFEFDIIRADTARWLDIGQPGTRAVRQAGRPADQGRPTADTSAASTPAPQLLTRADQPFPQRRRDHVRLPSPTPERRIPCGGYGQRS